MPRLTRQDREEIEGLGKDLFNMIFHALDVDYGGEIAGRVATAAQKAFEKAMTKEIQTDS